MNTTLAISQTKSTPVLSFLEKVLVRIEWFRVKNHLRIVEKELLRQNVDYLSPELRQERAKNISRLHEYWTQGIYPKNLDSFVRRVPYFKDAINTPCAMAYLIEQSGHQDLVNSVARSNNHVYINDIQSGPVMDWIGNSGLTKAEAARVQPTYGPGMGFGGGHDPIFQILPWIIGSVGFILLEWLSYKISSWVALDNSKRRIAAWAYFTFNNLLIAFIIGLLIGEFARDFWY